MKQKLLNQYYHLLARLAKGYIAKHNPYIIGINGSVGKTTCRNIVTQTIKTFFPRPYDVYSSPENFNGELGMPLSIFRIKDISPSAFSFLSVLLTCLRKRYFGRRPYDCIVLEYGIDRPKEMDFLLNIAKPHIGIFTKIDSVHSEQFGTPQAIAEEEAKMIKHTREVAFLNTDDPYARQLYGMINIDKFFYQSTAPHNEAKADILYGKDSIVHDKDRIVSSEFVIYNKDQQLPIRTNLIGKENYGYISVAFSILDIMWFQRTGESFFAPHIVGPIIDRQTEEKHKQTPDYVGRSKLQDTHLDITYKLIPGRLGIFYGINDSIIIDSSYNASPMSVKKIIETAFTLRSSLFPGYKTLLLLGDMRELGDFEEQEHRQIAGVIQMSTEKVVLVGPCTHTHTKDELLKVGYDPKAIRCSKHAHSAGAYIRDFLYESKDKRIVVVKGSQNTIYLEEAIKQFLHKEKHQHDHYHYLIRQSKWWIKKKAKYFKSL